MVLGKPAPFVSAFVAAVDDAMRAYHPRHTMSATQRAWRALCVTAVLVTNSMCWARFERASLGPSSLAALSWMLRHSQLPWDTRLVASVRVLLRPHGLTSGTLVIDDTDNPRSKSAKTLAYLYKQIPRSARRNPLPVKRINGSRLMGHEHGSRALGELRQLRQTPSGTERVLHHAPAAVEGSEVRPTRGREAMAATRSVGVVAGRVELGHPMDPAVIDDHHDLCAGCADGRHPWMARVAHLLGSTVRHDGREDCGGPLLDRPHDPEPPTAGETAPRALASPRGALERCVACALTLTQRAGGEARARGLAPPARAGPGTAPPERGVCRAPQDLATTSPGRQGSAGDSARGAGGRVGSAPPGGPGGAYGLCLHAPRTLARPSGPPVWWANTVASARPRHGAEREPGGPGACSTRRWRCGANAPGLVGGRPERGRSPQPCGPWLAKR